MAQVTTFMTDEPEKLAEENSTSESDAGRTPVDQAPDSSAPPSPAGDSAQASRTPEPSPPTEEAIPPVLAGSADIAPIGGASSETSQQQESEQEELPEEKQIRDEDILDEDEEIDEPVAPAGPIELVEEADEDLSMDWYILKVQSNRERSIADALKRKVAIEGLDKYFGQILVPTEKVTEFKAGKKKIVERKLWPGYIVVQMHINDDTWFAVRETAGIGDFTGAAGKPSPMLPSEVAKILQTDVEETDEAPRLNIKFNEGDKVKVKDGNFENFEGEVGAIDEASGKVTIMISIFGRSTPVELEYWQVEAV